MRTRTLVEIETLGPSTPAAPTPSGKKLGQLLVERGSLTGAQVLRGILSQKSHGGRIGTCLLEMELLNEDHLTAALAQQHGVSAAGVEELRAISEPVIELLPPRLAERCQAVPFAVEDGVLHVATPNVHQLALLDEISHYTGLRLQPHITSEVRLREALRRYYGVDCPHRFRRLVERLDHSRYLRYEERERRAAKARLARVQAADELVLRAPEEVFDLPELEGETPAAAAPSMPPRTWLVEATGDLAEARDAATVGAILLSAAIRAFRRAALLRIEADAATPWLPAGEGIDRRRFDAGRIDLRQPSILLQLRRGAAAHLGPLPPMPAHRQLVQAMGGGWPGECLILPVRIRGRLVLVLYGDGASLPAGGLCRADWERLAAVAGDALERCILETKERAN